MNENQKSKSKYDVGYLYHVLREAEHDLETGRCSAKESYAQYNWVKNKGIDLGHADLLIDACEYLGIKPSKNDLEKTLNNSFYSRGKSVDDAQTSTGYLFDILYKEGICAKRRDLMKKNSDERKKLYDLIIGDIPNLEFNLSKKIDDLVKSVYKIMFNLDCDLLSIYQFGKVISTLQPTGVSIDDKLNCFGRIYQDFFKTDFEEIELYQESETGQKIKINYHAIFGEDKEKLNYQIVMEKIKIYQLISSVMQNNLMKTAP